MERSPLALAALASAAVPGLDPATVEAMPSAEDSDYDVVFVTDTEDRRWSVRSPRTAAAGARMEMSAQLLGLLARRLPFSLPAPRGSVELRDDGRAEVYATLPGEPLNLSALPPGPGLAVELGRALAGVHNLEPALFDEAGLPSYDADAYRARRLAEVDRAAATRHVPTVLLSRWERALEDVTLWRFAAVPVHGHLTGERVLVTFGDTTDAATGRIRAVTGWEDAKVADPADDFAALVAQASEESVQTVLEAYAHSRVERPDANLLVRARLVGELALLARMTRAVTAGWTDVAARHVRALEQLAAEVEADPQDRLAAYQARVRTAPAASDQAGTTDPSAPDEASAAFSSQDAAAPAAPGAEELESAGSDPGGLDSSGPDSDSSGPAAPDRSAGDAWAAAPGPSEQGDRASSRYPDHTDDGDHASLSDHLDDMDPARPWAAGDDLGPDRPGEANRTEEIPLLSPPHHARHRRS